MRPLGPFEGREKEVFDFILAYKKENDGISPTIREIIAATDITSTSVTEKYLKKLKRRGLIRLGKRYQTRGLRVVGGRWEYDPPKNVL